MYKKLGEDALEKIMDNPYILIDVASKVSFEKVDKLAMELGTSPDSYKRVRSGIKYGLERIAINGNSTVIYENLVDYVEELLKVSKEAVEETIINMNNEIKNMCKESKSIYINMHDELTDVDGNFSEDYTNDGIHPNTLGYAKITRVLTPYIFEDYDMK